jgi:hypothetical protein
VLAVAVYGELTGIQTEAGEYRSRVPAQQAMGPNEAPCMPQTACASEKSAVRAHAPAARCAPLEEAVHDEKVGTSAHTSRVPVARVQVACALLRDPDRSTLRLRAQHRRAASVRVAASKWSTAVMKAAKSGAAAMHVQWCWKATTEW